MIRLFSLLLATGGFAQDRYRLEISPLDIRPGDSGVYLSRVSQIESDGESYFLASNQDTEIVVIDGLGNVVRTFGGKGGHPSELGYSGVAALTVRGDRAWVIDNEHTRVRHFKDGVYQDSFRLDSFVVSASSPAANTFAFSDQFVVVPAHHRTNVLAAAYLHDGSLLKTVGEPIDFQLSEKIIGMNDTHWLAHGDYWICIYKFYPLVLVFDAGFQLVDQIHIESAIITKLVDYTFQYETGAQFMMPFPVFSDAKIFRGDLYLFSKGELHQINLKTHRLKSITTFYGKGSDFKDVVDPNLTLYYFAFLEDGSFIVAHPALMWNHDLWTAKLPFIENRKI